MVMVVPEEPSALLPPIQSGSRSTYYVDNMRGVKAVHGSYLLKAEQLRQKYSQSLIQSAARK